jgi:biopolymer transport protein ExbD
MGNVRSKKQNTRIDFTSMVSIAFLLIVFFMLTSAMSKPQAMNLALPDNGRTCGGWHGGCGLGNLERTMTILLGANDKLICYTGFLEIPISGPKEMQYGKNGIRKELLLKAKSISDYNKSIGYTDKNIIVIIKPSKESKYKNLVDILDEMNIVGIETYAVINDFLPEEIKLLKPNLNLLDINN